MARLTLHMLNLLPQHHAVALGERLITSPALLLTERDELGKLVGIEPKGR